MRFVTLLLISLGCFCGTLRSQNSALLRDLKSRGTEAYAMGDLEEAASLLGAALTEARKQNELRDQVELLRMLGETNRAAEEFDTAMQLLYEAKNLNKTLRDSALENRICNRLSATHFAKDEPDSTEFYALRSLRYSIALKDTEFAANNFNILGALENRRENREKGTQYLLKAHDLLLASGKTRDLPNVLNNLAENEMRNENYQRAIRYSRQSLNLARKNNTPIYTQWAAGNLYRAYKILGDYQSALIFLEISSIERKKIYTENAAKQLMEARAKFRQEKVIAENEFLKKENQLRDEQIFAAILMSSLTLGLFIILIVVLNRARKRQKRVNKVLREKNRVIYSQNKEIDVNRNSLQELNTIKDRLFSVIAHDLRSPLNSLQGILTLLQKGALSETELISLTGSLTDRLDYTSILLDNLLKWSRSQLEGFTLSYSSFSLFDIAESQVRLLQSAAEAKDIRLENRVPPSLRVHSDPDLTEVIVRNLLSNSVKFTPKGGSVFLTAGQNEQEAWFAVTDSGKGMDQETIARLLGPEIFTTPGTRKEKGSGLGFLLVKDFVRKMGGEITVESEPDKGSVFRVSLPQS